MAYNGQNPMAAVKVNTAATTMAMIPKVPVSTLVKYSAKSTSYTNTRAMRSKFPTFGFMIKWV